MRVGREKEINLLQGLLEEEESQFVAIYGRRRVGKTFLIREAFNLGCPIWCTQLSEVFVCYIADYKELKQEKLLDIYTFVVLYTFN